MWRMKDTKRFQLVMYVKPKKGNIRTRIQNASFETDGASFANDVRLGAEWKLLNIGAKRLRNKPAVNPL